MSSPSSIQRQPPLEASLPKRGMRLFNKKSSSSSPDSQAYTHPNHSSGSSLSTDSTGTSHARGLAISDGSSMANTFTSAGGSSMNTFTSVGGSSMANTFTSAGGSSMNTLTSAGASTLSSRRAISIEPLKNAKSIKSRLHKSAMSTSPSLSSPIISANPGDVSLDTILRQPILLRAFESFMARALCEECLLFVKCLWQVKCDIGDPALVEWNIKRVVMGFIAQDAPMQVNISDVNRRRVEQRVAALKADNSWHDGAVEDVFEEAEREMMNLMAGRVYEFNREIEDVWKHSSINAVPANYQKRVVIIGGGFAGFTVAEILDKMPRFHVTLVDNKDYFEYSPAMIKMITKPESPGQVRVPHQRYVQFGHIVVGHAQAIHQGHVSLAGRAETGNEAARNLAIPYDYLVIATGCEWSLNVKTMEDVELQSSASLQSSTSMHSSTSPSSFRSRTTFATHYSAKRLYLDHADLAEASEVIIVGGSLMAIEIACAVASAYPTPAAIAAAAALQTSKNRRHSLQSCSSSSSNRSRSSGATTSSSSSVKVPKRVTLIAPSKRLAPRMKPSAHNILLRRLLDLDVHVVVGEKVAKAASLSMPVASPAMSTSGQSSSSSDSAASINRTRQRHILEMHSGRRFACDKVYVASGAHAPSDLFGGAAHGNSLSVPNSPALSRRYHHHHGPSISSFASSASLPVGLSRHKGRLRVMPTMQVPLHDHIFAAGDVGCIMDPKEAAAAVSNLRKAASGTSSGSGGSSWFSRTKKPKVPATATAAMEALNISDNASSIYDDDDDTVSSLYDSAESDYEENEAEVDNDKRRRIRTDMSVQNACITGTLVARNIVNLERGVSPESAINILSRKIKAVQGSDGHDDESVTPGATAVPSAVISLGDGVGIDSHALEVDDDRLNAQAHYGHAYTAPWSERQERAKWEWADRFIKAMTDGGNLRGAACETGYNDHNGFGKLPPVLGPDGERESVGPFM